MGKTAKQGFTLLEMSIVLIIIGVLAAAIIYGKSLIENSRLQQVITDVDSYTSAVGNFKQQYNALPGDFASAGQLWGYVGGGTSCSTAQDTTQGTGTQTCDGNADGMIGSVSGQEYETFRFWQQLQNAGMFSQSVTGVNNGTGVYDSMPGVNVPKSSFKGSGFSVIWLGTVANSDPAYFPGFYGNVLLLGGAYSYYNQSTGISTGEQTISAILTTDQAAAIDSKIDDGMPGTGKVRSPWGYFNGTVSGGLPNADGWCTSQSAPSSATSATYSFSASTTAGAACSLIFVMGF